LPKGYKEIMKARSAAGRGRIEVLGLRLLDLRQSATPFIPRISVANIGGCSVRRIASLYRERTKTGIGRAALHCSLAPLDLRGLASWQIGATPRMSAWANEIKFGKDNLVLA
jgi:hypothetical protein